MTHGHSASVRTLVLGALVAACGSGFSSAADGGGDGSAKREAAAEASGVDAPAEDGASDGAQGSEAAPPVEAGAVDSGHGGPNTFSCGSGGGTCNVGLQFCEQLIGLMDQCKDTPAKCLGMPAADRCMCLVTYAESMTGGIGCTCMGSKGAFTVKCG